LKVREGLLPLPDKLISGGPLLVAIAPIATWEETFPGQEGKWEVEIFPAFLTKSGKCFLLRSTWSSSAGPSVIPIAVEWILDYEKGKE